MIKDKLEDRQRSRRLANSPGEPQWFECVAPEKEGDLPRWRYKGGYWEARESGRWPQLPELYSFDQESAKTNGQGAVHVHARAAELLM